MTLCATCGENESGQGSDMCPRCIEDYEEAERSLLDLEEESRHDRDRPDLDFTP